MASLQHCLDHTHLSLLMQEIALKTVQGISPPVPQPISHLRGERMGAAGLWLLSLPQAMGQIPQAPPSLRPVLPRRSCTSYHTSQPQMNYTSYPNTSAQQKVSPLRTGAETHPCVRVPGVSALDVPPPAVTMK